MATAARSEARIDTKTTRMIDPLTAPATAASSSALGTSGSRPANRPTMAMSGSAIRASTFQTPVTIAEVEMSRREKPQERQIV